MAPERRPKAKITKRAHHARILVADDDDLIRAVLGDALEEAGFSVIHAANGREGVEKLAQNNDIDF